MTLRVRHADLFRYGAAGLTWAALGQALGISTTSARRLWLDHASPALKDTRRHAIAERNAVSLLPLIEMGCRGDAWRLVGAALYPQIADPDLAAAAAHNTFSRRASPEQKEARRQAIKANNSNRVPGLSLRAQQRRRRANIGVEWQARPEFTRPWAGMGECFR